MDSGELLDLLGNENRRRILQLLARKPCYVTEISEYIGVSPKAVIDHLRRLEDAGLVESRTDDRRRKYFHIARTLRLEVSVAPYGFGMKSAYPASASLDLGRCRHLSIDVDVDSDLEAASGEDQYPVGDPGQRDEVRLGPDATAVSREEATVVGSGDADGDEGAPSTAGSASVADLAEDLDDLRELDRELSLAQRWVQGRIADVRSELVRAVDGADDSNRHAEVLAAIAGGARTAPEVAAEVEAPPDIVRDTIASLRDRGVVEKRDGDLVVS
ncbi:MAG: ArsR/SmtB family transcription factor [Halobacteriaceae archaeon]